VVAQNLSSKSLVARKYHAARVASGVRHRDELKKAYDVLVVQRLVMKLLKEVEDNLGFKVDDGCTN
jgi:hypothetical protein